MEEVIENQDSLNTDDTQNDTQDEIDVDALKEQNKKLFERAKSAETKLKEFKSKPQSEPSPAYVLSDEIVDLRLEGYSKQDVEFIMKNGGRKSIEDKTSYVAIALNTKREQERAEREANKAPDNAGMSEVERKYTPEQLSKMSRAELEKILPYAN